jgi:hypothetical protein
MRFGMVRAVAFLIALLAPVAAIAQMVPPGMVPPGMPPGSPPQGASTTNPSMYGLNITCQTGPANLSLPVVWVFDYNLGDAGVSSDAQIAYPGGVPQVMVPPRIRLNPGTLIHMTPAMQYFIAGHECAHQFLPNAIRLVEFDADCWSAMEGMKQGYFGVADFPALQATFANNPGNWTHAPGTIRAIHIQNCALGNLPDGYGDDVSPYLI